MKKDTSTFPIHIELCDVEFEGTCGYSHTPGRPAYTSGLPENCYPEEPAETELFDLIISNDAGTVDMTLFLSNDEIRRDLEDQLDYYLNDY